jgi:homoserine dehydrogenase
MIIGFGTIGKGIAKAILQNDGQIKKAAGEAFRIVSIVESSGFAHDDSGLDLQKLLSEPEKVFKKQSDFDTIDFIKNSKVDVVVEVTPTNIKTGEPAASFMLAAMESGKHLVTSNKGPLTLYFKKLADAAEKNNVILRYEATVCGAIPLLNTVRENLSGDRILSLRGMFNGTCNYILTRMANEEMPMDQILRESQELGIAEADPSYDVDGIDSACKIVILANTLFGINVTYKDVKVTGIRSVTEEAVKLAKESKKSIKLIGEIDGNKLEVSPRLVPRGHPLDVGGTLNVVQLKTDLAREITIMGYGAGQMETASAVINDLISVSKARKK